MSKHICPSVIGLITPPPTLHTVNESILTHDAPLDGVNFAFVLTHTGMFRIAQGPLIALQCPNVPAKDSGPVSLSSMRIWFPILELDVPTSVVSEDPLLHSTKAL